MITVHLSERVTLFHGDALRVLATLPDAGVDAVLTDPPYSSGGQSIRPWLCRRGVVAGVF